MSTEPGLAACRSASSRAERTASERPLLSARGLEVVFPPRGSGRRTAPARAVDGVDLDLMSGEIHALAGESGCGKTTLARALLGLVPPTAGTVTYQGAPLATSTKALKAYRRSVQLILQDPAGALNPRHTVYEAVAEGLRIHGLVHDERERVADALARCGLRPPERFFLAYPHELSGGQRQRVVIAGALALRPRVLIADEPVASLDASVRGEILALLQRLCREFEMAALVVTHDLGLAWSIADRLSVMYLGRIVETGPTEEVLLSPRHPYTRALVSVLLRARTADEAETANRDVADGTTADGGATDGTEAADRSDGPIVLTGEPPDATAVPMGCRFHPRCPDLASGAAAAAGVEQDCRTVPLPILSADAPHAAACHLTRRV